VNVSGGTTVESDPVVGTESIMNKDYLDQLGFTKLSRGRVFVAEASSLVPVLTSAAGSRSY
jgi:hypothetical protein